MKTTASIILLALTTALVVTLCACQNKPVVPDSINQAHADFVRSLSQP
jgi:hypothetical protein